MTWIHVQALLGIGLSLLGFGGFYRIMDRSADYTPNGGMWRVLLCVGAMLAGGILIALARHP